MDFLEILKKHYIDAKAPLNNFFHFFIYIVYMVVIINIIIISFFV